MAVACDQYVSENARSSPAPADAASGSRPCRVFPRVRRKRSRRVKSAMPAAQKSAAIAFSRTIGSEPAGKWANTQPIRVNRG